MTGKVIPIVMLSLAAGVGLTTGGKQSGLWRDTAFSPSHARVPESEESHSAADVSGGVPDSKQRSPEMNHLASSTPAAPTSLASDGAHSPSAGQQTGPATFDPAPVVPLASQPPARLIVDAPLPAQLANGYVVIRYRAENLRILPVFGPAALAVIPRIGHLHITVDDAPWHWLDASGQPISINGLLPGPHKVLIELEDPSHKAIDSAIVRFDIPERKAL